jgi:hypothetical protein
MSKPATHNVEGGATGRSNMETIFNELGYLGDAIH